MASKGRMFKRFHKAQSAFWLASVIFIFIFPMRTLRHSTNVQKLN